MNQPTKTIATFEAGAVWTADGKYPVRRIDIAPNPETTLPARGHQYVNGVLYVSDKTDWRALILPSIAADDSTLTPKQEARLASLLGRGVPLGSDGRIRAGGILDGKTPEEVMRDRDDYRRIVGE